MHTRFEQELGDGSGRRKENYSTGEIWFCTTREGTLNALKCLEQIYSDLTAFAINRDWWGEQEVNLTSTGSNVPFRDKGNYPGITDPETPDPSE
jgi:hypothetical protein